MTSAQFQASWCRRNTNVTWAYSTHDHSAPKLASMYVRSVTRRLCLCRLHLTASPLALALVVRMRTCVCLQDGTGRRCARHNGPNIAMTRKRKTRQKRQSRRREPDPKPEGETPTSQRPVRTCVPKGGRRKTRLARSNPPYETGPAVRDQTSHVQPRSPRASPDPSGAAASTGALISIISI